MAVPQSPFSTVSAGGWDKSGAASIHAAVADSVASSDDDGTYAFCADGTACELALDAIDHPNRTDGHFVRVRSRKAVDTSQTCTLRVELKCGATLIATVEFDEPAAYDDTEIALSDSEAAAISNYADLRIVLTDVASPLTSEHRVTSLEFEAPDRILRAHISD